MTQLGHQRDSDQSCKQGCGQLVGPAGTFPRLPGEWGGGRPQAPLRGRGWYLSPCLLSPQSPPPARGGLASVF